MNIPNNTFYPCPDYAPLLHTTQELFFIVWDLEREQNGSDVLAYRHAFVVSFSTDVAELLLRNANGQYGVFAESGFVFHGEHCTTRMFDMQVDSLKNVM